jgi:hypothetical protein
MSIKLHKVIHCFDSLIILLYEHPFTIYFDTHRWPDLNVIDVWLYKLDSSLDICFCIKNNLYLRNTVMSTLSNNSIIIIYNITQ